MTYLLFQMALYMLATLLLGFLLGWYIWGNLFEEGNVLGKLGFSGGAGAGVAGGSGANVQALERKNSDLQGEVSRLNAHRASLENDLDACKAARAALEQEIAALKSGSTKAAGASKSVAFKSEAGAKRTAKPASAAKVKVVAAKPKGLDGPRGGKADDLTQIKGIGPKLAKMLNGMGFYHFDQIASWGASELSWVDDNLEGFKGRASRDEWIKQAKKLA